MSSTTIPLLTKELESEFQLRTDKVREKMIEAGTDAILIGSSVNIFYMSGAVFRGYIYISTNTSPLFFLIPPSETEKMENIIPIRKPEQIAEKLSEQGISIPRKIGFEFADLSYSDIERLKGCFPASEATDASSIMRKARMVKTDHEIGKMREDGVRQAMVYSKIHRCYHEDMTDLEFQIEIERILRLEGCLGILRTAGSRMELNMGSVLNGDNADNPSPYDFSMGGRGVDPSLPVGADGLTMRPGTAVMVDMNGGFNGYQTDMTRCWMIGEVEQLAVKAHECSRAILRHLEKIGTPGTPVALLYNEAMEMAKQEGLHDYFMGHHHKVSFIGHGVGIELNEQPVVMAKSRDILAKDMTIALEPKFVIPHVGAVGVENTYRVGDEGLENLTSFKEELTQL